MELKFEMENENDIKLEIKIEIENWKSNIENLNWIWKIELDLKILMKANFYPGV